VGLTQQTKFTRIQKQEREKEMELTIKELQAIHSALITRERILRDNFIPACEGTSRVEELKTELDLLPGLRSRICAAQLSKELGFEISPVGA
jgi:hypothetical protein